MKKRICIILTLALLVSLLNISVVSANHAGVDGVTHNPRQVTHIPVEDATLLVPAPGVRASRSNVVTITSSVTASRPFLVGNLRGTATTESTHIMFSIGARVRINHGNNVSTGVFTRIGNTHYVTESHTGDSRSGLFMVTMTGDSLPPQLLAQL